MILAVQDEEGVHTVMGQWSTRAIHQMLYPEINATHVSTETLAQQQPQTHRSRTHQSTNRHYYSISSCFCQVPGEWRRVLKDILAIFAWQSGGQHPCGLPVAEHLTDWSFRHYPNAHLGVQMLRGTLRLFGYDWRGVPNKEVKCRIE